MPTFARTDTGKWHVVGPDGCRYGRQFAADSTPSESVSESDIIAYEPPTDRTGQASTAISLSTGAFPRGESHQQRLVLPSAIEDSETGLCDSCRSLLESQQSRRSKVITTLKQSTPRREIDWERTEHTTPQACDWCRATEATTYTGLHARICPACRRLFGTPFGEPAEETAPETDRLPTLPKDVVTPIVFGTTLPEYTPTDLIGSNRPVIKYREKHKYAELIFELERTGHGFTTDGYEALEEIRREYAASVADIDDHATSVSLQLGKTPRTITLDGILPADHCDVIMSCWAVVSDPEYWFPLGWPQQGYIHRREASLSIPGEVPVAEEFPRLKTQQPKSSVNTETLRSVTDPGRFERGERYYERGAVTTIGRIDDRLQATVQGSRPYDVEATFSDGSYIEGACSCPDDTVPCKHIVAAVLASGDAETVGSKQSLEQLLETAAGDTLRSLLESLAEEHIEVRKQIYEELS